MTIETTRALEERVAALEAALTAKPGLRAFDGTLSDETVEDFRAKFAGAVAPLTREQVRQLLSECVTVVKPGETVIIRTTDLTPGQMDEYQQWFSYLHESGDLPFRTVIVHGDGLGVQEAAG